MPGQAGKVLKASVIIGAAWLVLTAGAELLSEQQHNYPILPLLLFTLAAGSLLGGTLSGIMLVLAIHKLRNRLAKGLVIATYVLFAPLAWAASGQGLEGFQFLQPSVDLLMAPIVFATIFAVSMSIGTAVGIFLCGMVAILTIVFAHLREWLTRIKV